MDKEMTRRALLGAVGVVTARATTATAAKRPAGKTKKAAMPKILGISCSPRKGKTTATAVQISLAAAAQVDPIIDVELLDLGGLNIGGWIGGAKPGQGTMPKDDFQQILPKLKDPNLGGFIIGSPVYFRSMSALCKAFLEQCAVLRKPRLLLTDKPVGVLAVGSFRNGGQELVVQQIQTAMLCHEVMIVGGKPKAHQGATLWNMADDDITKDTFGISTAKLLGQRVGQAALKLAGLTLE